MMRRTSMLVVLGLVAIVADAFVTINGALVAAGSCGAGLSGGSRGGLSKTIELEGSASGLKKIVVQGTQAQLQKDAEIADHLLSDVKSSGGQPELQLSVGHSPGQAIIERVIQIESKPHLVQIERPSGRLPGFPTTKIQAEDSSANNKTHCC